MDEKKDDLIPLEQVLEDMYDPDAGMGSNGARAYYYLHYASEQERKAMDREDRTIKILGWIYILTVAGLLAFAVIKEFIL